VPWLTFKDILRYKPRSILLTSGTLKPMNMWEKELKLKFTNQLTNGHVISEEQIAARVIKAGPSKVRFTFTFDNLSKNRNEIYKDLIEFIIQAASRIPNGILLVFPSFKIQMDFKYELMRSSKKERLTAVKDIIFEEKSMDLNMNDFKRKALSSKGAILAIICRGKVSEGIDFPDGMCRAVFIVGIPYPNIRDPFIIEKKSHLENIAARSVNKS
jgi:regulator of telomere elongation helicase 1